MGSFFGAPKDGSGGSSGRPLSPAKKSRSSLPSKAPPKSKAKKNKVAAVANAKPSGKSLAPAESIAASGPSPKEIESSEKEQDATTNGANGAIAAGKRKAEEKSKGVGIDNDKEGVKEGSGRAQPKRLCRLTAKVNPGADESDDDMFGEGGGRGEGKRAAAAKKVVDDDEMEEDNDVGDKGGDGYKDEGEQGPSGEEPEPDTAEEEDVDHDDEADEQGGKAEPKKRTVSSALMAGGKKSKASSSPSKKKKAASLVTRRTSRVEDVLAKVSWKSGQPVPYGAFCDMLHTVEETSSRLEITRIFCEFLCQVIATTPEDLASIVYLAANELAPAYEGVELGIGDTVLQKAIVGATGRSAKDVKAAAVEAGDLGKVAQHSTKAQGTLSFGQTVKTLSCSEVLERFRGIARVKGNLSQDEKIKRIKKMLVSCKGVQAKYIIRGLQGRMRVGLNVSTVMGSTRYWNYLENCWPCAGGLSAVNAIGPQLRYLKLGTHPMVVDCMKGLRRGKREESLALSHAAVLCPSDVAKAAEKDQKDPEASDKDRGFSTVGGTENDVELIPAARELRDAKEKDVERRLELATQVVKQAYSECPNFDLVVKAILSAPLYRLQQSCRLTPGVPVSPMLAKPTKSIGEVLQRLSGQEFTCEYKYDGMRAQVHLLEDGSLRFFSRNSKDSSGELPDVIPVMKDCVKDGVKTYVIDTEVVAYDRDSENLLPFQMLSTRGRKDVDAKEVKVKVIVEAFDILYLNGKSLLQEPLNDRRVALRDTFKEVDGRFRFATFMDHKEDGDTGPIEDFLSEAVRGNCEGLMVKTLTKNASYEPSRRSLNWLKLKKDYLQAEDGGVGDSLDLVPIGAFYGTGKRTGRYGAYLLACYDADREEYQSVSKIGTGFTDDLLLSFWEDLKEHTLDTRPRYYNAADSLGVDVWLAPRKVWEVKCADLSKSPVHRAAVGKLEPDRGISIRFPRLLRERDDKDPEQATTADEILDMYENQDIVKNNTAVGAQAVAADDDWEL